MERSTAHVDTLNSTLFSSPSTCHITGENVLSLCHEDGLVAFFLVTETLLQRCQASGEENVISSAKSRHPFEFCYYYCLFSFLDHFVLVYVFKGV